MDNEYVQFVIHERRLLRRSGSLDLGAPREAGADANHGLVVVRADVAADGAALLLSRSFRVGSRRTRLGCRSTRGMRTGRARLRADAVKSVTTRARSSPGGRDVRSPTATASASGRSPRSSRHRLAFSRPIARPRCRRKLARAVQALIDDLRRRSGSTGTCALLSARMVTATARPSGEARRALPRPRDVFPTSPTVVPGLAVTAQSVGVGPGISSG
jgi:hypothetical protein